jgi:hypothetical protein
MCLSLDTFRLCAAVVHDVLPDSTSIVAECDRCSTSDQWLITSRWTSLFLVALWS